MPSISLLPKLLIAVLFIAIIHDVSTFRKNSLLMKSASSSLTDEPSASWFLDAARRPQQDSEDDEDETGFENPTSSVTNVASDTAKTTHRDYRRLHVAHGYTQCMPHFDHDWQQAVIERNASCSRAAPFSIKETRRVGFASITTGKPTDAYQRAILTQMFHAAVHNIPIHILCNDLSEGAWNKIAFLLNLVMEEMLKPASTRLEWIMWIDRDAIILDACRPLSSFLPPNDPAFDKIQLITNEDAYSFNAGIFMFKVGPWMIDFFNTVLAIRYYRPDTQLPTAEQTALDIIMKEEERKDNFVRVPWYWFNAYPDETDSVARYKQGQEPADLEWFRARKGDFAVHFAGDSGRSVRMVEWEDMIKEMGNVWEGDTLRDVSDEIAKYWDSWKHDRLSTKQITGDPDADDKPPEKKEEKKTKDKTEDKTEDKETEETE